MRGKKGCGRWRGWVEEEFRDKYVEEGEKKGLGWGGWFKVDEIEESEKVFKGGMRVVEVGGGGGGW